MALPSGYKRLDYLESSGTQYINTGVDVSAGARIVSKFAYASFTLSSSFAYLYGAENNASPWNCLDVRVYSTAGETDFEVFTTKIYRPTLSINTIYDSDFDFRNKSNISVTLNGTKYPSVSATNGLVAYPVYIFAADIANSPTRYSCARIYTFEMYDVDNEPTRNYMPALRISDSKPGLYDLLNDQFYTNAGTGEFTYGSVIDETLNIVIGDNPLMIQSIENDLSLIAYFERISSLRYKINGAWKYALPYIKIKGRWRKAIAYRKINGSWKKGL